jgi:hypothetical protein
MKFSKKRQQYESSNVSFNPETLEAYSYSWWAFSKVIDGKLVFNAYGYSMSTRKHQRKVRDLMDKLGLKPDLTLFLTDTTLSYSALESESRLAKIEIEKIKETLNNSRRKKALDSERQSAIMRLENHIKQVETVLYGSELNAALN